MGGDSLTNNLNIKISNINVDSKYFSFNYEYNINDGELSGQNEYSSSHDWGNDTVAFENMLYNGYAFKLALEEIVELIEF